MKLLLQRAEPKLPSDPTLGELYIDSRHECFTLELPRGDGLPGSCIPAGTYKVILTESEKFGSDLQFVALCEKLGVPVLIPRLVGIPNRSLIDVHWGNVEANTEGCILVGETEDAVHDFIGASRLAFATLYQKIVAAVNGEGCSIEVVDPVVPEMGVEESTT